MYSTNRFSTSLRRYLLFLFLFVVPIYMWGQTRLITGVVVDDYGEPIIGASIYIPGTLNGAISNLDGEFSLTISEEDTRFEVSFIGFIPQTVQITESSVYRVVLSEDAMMLDEMVIVGYGIESTSTSDEKKRSATTWKRSGLKDNSLRLEVGENDYLPLQSAQVAVQVDGFRVRVLMDCFFYNDKGSWLEGTFKLKLPAEASPYYFAFGEVEFMNEEEENRQNAHKIPFQKYSADNFNLLLTTDDEEERDWKNVKRARIVSRQKAAKTYEETVSAQVDPALMEWGGADMFSCRVYPLSNNKLHQIVIGYDLYMTEALGFREYQLVLPTVQQELMLDVILTDTPEMKTALSPALSPTGTHEGRTYYSLSNPKEKEITIRYDQTDPIMLVQAEDENNDIPYFAATYRVDLPESEQEDLPTDAIFLLDVSLSSNPDKFNVWVMLLEEILRKNEDVIKQFALLSFNIESRWYSRNFQRNNTYNVDKLMEYINALSLEGATDLSAALAEASSPAWQRKKKSSPKHIFILSDADCNWGETNMHAFNQLISPGDRIHTYKTGLPGTNATLLNYLSKQSGGFAFTVTGEEEAKLTARSFRYKPWDIEHIEMAGSSDFLISGQPNQLYNGQKLIFTGRDIPSGKIRIEARCGNERKTLEYAPAATIQSSLVSRIYGQIATAWLENYGYLAEEAAVNYSTFYQIPGLYTSFLMLETSWEYHGIAIEHHEAQAFVEEYPVTALVGELENKAALSSVGNGKADFSHWLETLEESEVVSYYEDAFTAFIEQLPEDVFRVKRPSYRYNTFLQEELPLEVREKLNDEDIRFDSLYKLAQRRSSRYGKPDGMKLLSSVVEKNGGDFQAIRDVAIIANEWGMPDHAYFLMRRIIDGRHGEALAYLTAAEALEKNGNIELALIYYYLCMEGNWDDDYGSIELMASLKCLRFIRALSNNSKYAITKHTRTFMEELKVYAEGHLTGAGFDPGMTEAGIMVMVSWNIPDTDIDLWVKEPTGELCDYSNRKTEIGGYLSMDVMDGYGPEMYILEKAVPGKYSIILDYYNESGTQTASLAKAYIEIYRNWGGKKEKRNFKIVELRRTPWTDFDDIYDDDEKAERKEEKQKTVMSFRIR